MVQRLQMLQQACLLIILKIHSTKISKTLKKLTKGYQIINSPQIIQISPSMNGIISTGGIINGIKSDQIIYGTNQQLVLQV